MTLVDELLQLAQMTSGGTRVTSVKAKRAGDTAAARVVRGGQPGQPAAGAELLARRVLSYAATGGGGQPQRSRWRWRSAPTTAAGGPAPARHRRRAGARAPCARRPALAHSTFVALSANALPEQIAASARAASYDDYWTKAGRLAIAGIGRIARAIRLAQPAAVVLRRVRRRSCSGCGPARTARHPGPAGSRPSGVAAAGQRVQRAVAGRIGHQHRAVGNHLDCGEGPGADAGVERPAGEVGVAFSVVVRSTGPRCAPCVPARPSGTAARHGLPPARGPAALVVRVPDDAAPSSPDQHHARARPSSADGGQSSSRSALAAAAMASRAIVRTGPSGWRARLVQASALVALAQVRRCPSDAEGAGHGFCIASGFVNGNPPGASPVGRP